MKRAVLLFIILFSGFGIPARSNHNQYLITSDPQPLLPVISDSVKIKNYHESESDRQTMHKKLVIASDTLTLSDYLMSIDRVNDNLNSIRDSTSLGFEAVRLKRSIEDMTGDINMIRQNVRGRNSVANIKNLYLYQSFASELNNENNRIRAHLSKTYNRVYNSKLRLKTILSDSVFRDLNSNNNLTKTFELKLARLERKWVRTDSTIKANIDSLNALKVKMTDNSLNLSNMLNIMDVRLDKAGKQLFRPEVNCLWQKTQKDTISGGSFGKVVSLPESQKRAISYYFNEISGQRVFVVFLGVLLFIWFFFKRKFITTLRRPDESFSFLHLQYLNTYPVLSMLVLLLCMMTFFDANAPTSYTAILYSILLVVLSVIFFKNENLNFSFSWLILVILFIVNAFTYLLIEPTPVVRFWILTIQINIIVFSYLFYKKLNEDLPYYKLIKRASIAAVLLSGLSVLTNIFGRITLSGIFGIAAIFAVTQAVVLPFFINIIIEIILIQLQISRIKRGFNKPFNISIVIEEIKMPLGIVAVVLWLIMFTSNLIIYQTLTESTINFLTAPRSIGSISFKLVSLLWFFVVIWFAHILQKLISILFGESGVQTEDTSPISKKQQSRLLIMRLLVLVGGYMLAIAASGLPIDKLTFLLGALGIGIGMGLQNVVNNFVSGIILIFEGMFKIGDIIEVSGQSGKVKEIGMRASTLNTADGAEVIIPNGTILSQNVINWTLSDDQKRIILWFILSGKELDSNIINEVINDTIKNLPDVISRKKPVILYDRVTSETCTITIRFWSTINNADNVKSEAMLRLSTAFTSKGIGFI